MVSNLAAGTIFDPTNLLGPGVGHIQEVAQGLRYGQEYNAIDRALGTAYNAATKNLSALGQGSVRAVFGPITSGVVRAHGVGDYVELRKALTDVDVDYGTRFQEAYGRGLAQTDRAVMGIEMGRDATAQLASRGKNIAVGLEERLTAQRMAHPDMLSRDAENLIQHRSPSFLGYDQARLIAESAPKLAAITGMSPTEAERVLQGMSVNKARQIQLAFYGHVGHELSTAKAALHGAPNLNIDVERLALLAPDTLHDEAALEFLKETANLDQAAHLATDAAVEKYSVLSLAYLGREYKVEDVRKLVKQLLDEDALPTVVKAPKSRRNLLPEPLTDFRSKWRGSGYDLGFAPADGWKVIVDADGTVIASDPFIHFSDEVLPVNVANPLGRFADSMFRGINQTGILYDSRDRFVTSAFEKGTGISQNQARSIHRKILDMAADRATSPRGLAWHVEDIEAAFRSVLDDTEYLKLREKVEPTWMVMNSFEGNLNRIGWSQKLTGRAKTVMTAGNQNFLAVITDAAYPGLRFRYQPLFQGQELAESPFFNIMRGVTNEVLGPDEKLILDEMSAFPEYRFMHEAGATLNLAGSAAVQTEMGASTTLGRALGKIPNIKGFKEQMRAAQVMYEHGEHFREAVLRINPDLWAKMVDAFGTSEPRLVASRYFAEHLAYVREGRPVSWRGDDVARGMEGTRPEGFGVATSTRGHPLWDQQKVSAAFQRWGLSVPESDALAALAEARAATWAAQHNLPAADWYATHLADITVGGTPGDLAQIQQQVVEKVTRIVGDEAGMTQRLIGANDEKVQLTRLNRLRRVAPAKAVRAWVRPKGRGGAANRLSWVNDAGRRGRPTSAASSTAEVDQMADSTIDAPDRHGIEVVRRLRRGHPADVPGRPPAGADGLRLDPGVGGRQPGHGDRRRRLPGDEGRHSDRGAGHRDDQPGRGVGAQRHAADVQGSTQVVGLLRQFHPQADPDLRR